MKTTNLSLFEPGRQPVGLNRPAAADFHWTKEALRTAEIISIEPNTPEVRARIHAEYRTRLKNAQGD